jgi:parallel beta-helix repeat protein
MRRTVLFAAVAATALAFAVADGAATEQATLVVDNDGAQCAQAEFATIQAAIDAASPGDTIRVCPGVYAESVRIGKPLTLEADADANEAVDCFDPAPSQLGDLDPTLHAIIDPAGTDFSIAVKLEANDIELSGFVIEGASVGVDAPDRFSGYRIRHNLIRLNTLFAIDFGSEGTHESRVDHNCIRLNRFGLVSELDDDSLWKQSDGPERDEWNTRNLVNARIDHNETFRNRAGLEAAGPGRPDRVTFEYNVLVEDAVGIAIQNSIDSAIVANDITTQDPWPVTGVGTTFPVIVGGNNARLEIGSNRARGGRNGMSFQIGGFIDLFPSPSTDVVAAGNIVSGMTRTGIAISGATAILPPAAVRSHFEGNTSNENGFHGFIVLSGSRDNTFVGNRANGNGGNGIYAAAGAYPNTFAQNSMHDNGWNPILVPPLMTDPKVDARDDNTPLNTWIGNRCGTDFPDGAICGIG